MSNIWYTCSTHKAQGEFSYGHLGIRPNPELHTYFRLIQSTLNFFSPLYLKSCISALSFLVAPIFLYILWPTLSTAHLVLPRFILLPPCFPDKYRVSTQDKHVRELRGWDRLRRRSARRDYCCWRCCTDQQSAQCISSPSRGHSGSRPMLGVPRTSEGNVYIYFSEIDHTYNFRR